MQIIKSGHNFGLLAVTIYTVLISVAYIKSQIFETYNIQCIYM